MNTEDRLSWMQKLANAIRKMLGLSESTQKKGSR